MGALGDIMTMMKKASGVTNAIRQSNIRGKSIMQRANESTFQFPCLISNTAPIDMATAITRMMDRVYAGYTQIAIGNESTMNLSMDRTPMEFLKRFHQNLKYEQTIADLSVPDNERELYMEKVYTGEYKLYSNPEHTHYMLFNVANSGVRTLLENNREMLEPYLSDINIAPIYEADADTDDIAQLYLAGKLKQAKRQDAAAQGRLDSFRTGPKLTDGDVKRINDMMPYAVQVRLSVVNSEEEFVQYIDCIIGCKTVLHLIDSQDMIMNLEHTLQNKSGLFRFLRWTTGEISLFKDLLLHMDDLRFDAANENNGKNPLIANLRKLKRRKIGFSMSSLPHGLVPNATIVVTSYETSYMENKYGIRLHDVLVARKLIDALNLATFIICDDSTGTIDILYANDATFQTYALESIEREVSMNSNKLGREIGRMIAH